MLIRAVYQWAKVLVNDCDVADFVGEEIGDASGFRLIVTGDHHDGDGGWFEANRV
jgi:hypothetical protein